MVVDSNIFDGQKQQQHGFPRGRTSRGKPAPHPNAKDAPERLLVRIYLLHVWYHFGKFNTLFR
jgi:hypothetical protein